MNNAASIFDEAERNETKKTLKASMGDYWGNCVSERFQISKGKRFSTDSIRNLQCEFSYRMEADRKVNFKIENSGIIGIEKI